MIAATKIRALEGRLAQFAGRDDAVLVGQANTALHLALRYLHSTRGPGEVILSPIVCPSVVQTIIYAGFEPVFVDISLPLCTINVDAAARAIGSKTRAILGIHIFGHSADMPALATLAERHGIWLIEDAAQSIGGTVAGRRHGAWGQVSLYSFGGSKIVSAGGGGALLADDGELVAFVRGKALLLPELNSDANFKLLSLSHRNITHALTDALRVQRDATVWRALQSLLETYRPLFLHRFPDDERIIETIDRGIDGIEVDTGERARRAMAYRSGLSGLEPALQLPDRDVCEGVIWRFTTIISDDQQAIAITKKLRQAGLHASNHYWSVAELLQGRRDLPNADFASSRLLNLWVEPAISKLDIERTIEVIRLQLS